MHLDAIHEAMNTPFTESNLPLPGKTSGKVRDMYNLTDNSLLMVTTDRISAFDRVLGTVPYKGQVLNQLTAWWLKQTNDIIGNPMQSIPDPNAMITLTAQPFPVEVIVRGFITGVTTTALWYRYSLGERVIYGHSLPDGLQKNQQLPQPLITPTTKGGPGQHDERLTCEEVVEKDYLDAETWDAVQQAALALFERGQQAAASSGLILVDTKYEFGRLPDGSIAIIDEIHTPDSSRYWLADGYKERLSAGKEPENYDKEFLRIEYANQGYRGEGEPPSMPDNLWIQLSQRYIDLFERLTGGTFKEGSYPIPERLTANLIKENVL